VIFEKKSLTGVLFCEETLHVLEDLLVKISTRKHEKHLQLIWGKYDTVLGLQNCPCQKIGISPVLKMATFSSCFVQAASAQNIAVLKRCRSRTSDNAYCAFRNISKPVSAFINQELAIISHFLAQQLEITLIGLPCGPSEAVPQLESLIFENADVSYACQTGSIC